MALTKITSDVIAAGAVESTHIASGAISSSHLSSITTDNVSEGSTNTYFTNARARSSVSVTGGGLSYDSGTGVIQIGSIPNASLTNSSLTVNSNSVSLGSSVTLDTDDIGEGSTNLYFTNARAQGAISGGTGVTVSSGTISIGQDVATSSTPTFGNITTTGYIAGPATFTIDPAAVGDNTGTVVIAGNLQVDGTTTTINSTTLEVDDLNITLASGAANAAAANGAGITVDCGSDTDATFIYDGTNDEWDFNKDINVTGELTTTSTINSGGSMNIASSGTSARYLQIGLNTTDNHFAYIDLVGDATYTDYGLRLIRNNSGANTSSQLIHRGTGNLDIQATDSASIRLRTASQDALTISSSQNATFAGTIDSGAITSSGNLHVGDGTDISMDASANGQLEVDGDGYQGAIALDGDAMHVYHNSSSRDLILGTNETARLTIGGTGTFTFHSNDLQSIGTIDSGAITSSAITTGGLTFSNGGDRSMTGPLNQSLLINARPNNSTEGLKLKINGVDKLSILQDGNATFAGTIDSGAITSTGIITSQGDAALNDAQIGRLNFTNTNSNASSNPIRASIFAGRQNSAWGGYLSFYTSTGTDAATEKVRIGETGNVGIGTTSPTQSKLVVDGTISIPRSEGFQYLESISGGFRAGIFSTSTNATGLGFNSLRFFVNADNTNPAMVIGGSTNNKRVGIGTTNPQMGLHVGSGSQSTAALSGIGIANGSSDYSFYSASDGTKQYIAGVDHNITYTKSGTLSNHDHAIVTNNTSRIYIENTGNVGIGTDSPDQQLHIEGSSPAIRIESTGSSGGVIIIGEGNNDKAFFGTANHLISGDSVNNAAIRANSKFSIATGSSGTRRLRIDENGQSIIGTASISGSVATHGVILSDGGRNGNLGTTIGDTQRVVAFHNQSHNQDYLTFRTRRITDEQPGWNHAVWDITRDIDNTSDLYRYITFGIGDLVVNDFGANMDFRVESNTNANMLFVDGGSNRVGIGTNSPSQFLDVRGHTQIGDGGGAVLLNFNATGNAQLKFGNTEWLRHSSSGTTSIGNIAAANFQGDEAVLELYNDTGSHDPQLYMRDVSAQTATGRQFSVMEGAIYLNGTGDQIKIPYTTQGGSWRKHLIIFDFVGVMYNNSSNGYIGGGKIAMSTLSTSHGASTLYQNYGMVTSVTHNPSTGQVFINLSSSIPTGLSNGNGIFMSYKILTESPDGDFIDINSTILV